MNTFAASIGCCIGFATSGPASHDALPPEAKAGPRCARAVRCLVGGGVALSWANHWSSFQGPQSKYGATACTAVQSSAPEFCPTWRDRSGNAKPPSIGLLPQASSRAWLNTGSRASAECPRADAWRLSGKFSSGERTDEALARNAVSRDVAPLIGVGSERSSLTRSHRSSRGRQSSAFVGLASLVCPAPLRAARSFSDQRRCIA